MEKHCLPGSETQPQKRSSVLRVLLKILGHFLLALLALVAMVLMALVLVCNLIFNGPSPTARDVLTMSMLESSGMKWCPALFIGEETVAKIQENKSSALPEEISDVSQVFIQTDTLLSGSSDEWDAYPDGIRIDSIQGETYTAHVMVIRDPSRVYTAVSGEMLSIQVESKRIDQVMEIEGALAGINGGAFNDDGTGADYVGRVPIGLVYSKGTLRWEGGGSYRGFVGLTEDHVLVVAKSMTPEQAKALKIRDCCCFGPVLIINGTVNESAYNAKSGYNPRTCIGQRADGAIVFLCIDGRQASSLGGTYADAIDILVEYGVINACNLDGGSSTVMYYRDTYGRYGEPDQLVMINNYSLLQEQAREMPTFFMVAPEKDEE